MKFYSVEKFDKTGLVKTFFLPKDQGRWRIYSYDIIDGMKDLAYYNDLGMNFGITADNMIRTRQEHTSNVLVAKNEDKGLGVVKLEPEISYDGLITNEKNIMLLTVEADCTPIYILDPINKAIGMVHSGWRGTVKRIVINALELMKENYGTDKEKVLIHFGPAICGDCYEVGIELIDEFKKILMCDDIHRVFKPIIDKPEKYMLDVTESIKVTLINYGVPESNITKTNYCTFHDNLFHSWRREHDKTKQMLTGIMLI